MSLDSNKLIIQKLEKKAFDLSMLANRHGISLISSIAFLSLTLISSLMGFPSIVMYSSFSFCILSSTLTLRFYKILKHKISNIIDEKNALNIRYWDIKKPNIFSYYTIEFSYKCCPPIR